MKKYVFIKDETYGSRAYSKEKILSKLEEAFNEICAFETREQFISYVELLKGTSKMLCYKSVVYFLAYASVMQKRKVIISFGTGTNNSLYKNVGDEKCIDHVKVILDGEDWETHWENANGYKEVDQLEVSSMDFNMSYEAYYNKLNSYKYLKL